MNLYNGVRDHDFAETTCFLCGATNLKGDSSREHVFPKWLLHYFGLWDKQIDLLNGSPIPYRQLVIPCCKECNNKHLSKIEDQVKNNFEAGAKALREMDRVVLMLWTLKIFYGLLYREIFLPLDRRAPNAATILHNDDMERFQMLHYILQASRVPMRFSGVDSDIPASLFVFDLLEPEELSFDYRDNFVGKTLYLRMGQIGLLACFDMGAQTCEGHNFFPLYQQHKLHQVQFEELGANLFLKAQKFNRVPQIVFSESPNGVTFCVLPIWGLSASPAFDASESHELAEVLSLFLGYPLDVVMPLPDRTATWLTNSDGSIRHF